MACAGPYTAAVPPLDLPEVRQSLLGWFDRRGRDLPWRLGHEGGRDPYRVWVAEILLQQTQVSRGLLYYQRFLEHFPTVQALAAAPIDDVLKAWEGCGYYARARNLHRAAGLIAENGFPVNYAGWLALPGVGPYTAAAVTSLALNERRAVNDGNVRRVLARLYAERQPAQSWVQARAEELLDPGRPGAWNEAMMDLGATVCTPRAPTCQACPLSAYCAAFRAGEAALFPAPKVRAQVREVRAVAVLIGDAEHAVLEQRAGNLLGGLWGLPLAEPALGETPAQALARLCERLHAVPGDLLGTVNHTMTHRRIRLDVYLATLPGAARQPTAQMALSRLDHKALGLLKHRQAGLFSVS